MKRLFLGVLLLAAPAGCATQASWMAEFDRDPDLQTSYVWRPDPAAAPASPSPDAQVEPADADRP